MVNFQKVNLPKESTRTNRSLYYLVDFLTIYPTREALLKGKAQYSWPPCPNWFVSAYFYIENIIYLFYKTSYPNEEVNGTEHSVSVPWAQCYKVFTDVIYEYS